MTLAAGPTDRPVPPPPPPPSAVGPVPREPGRPWPLGATDPGSRRPWLAWAAGAALVAVVNVLVATGLAGSARSVVVFPVVLLLPGLLLLTLLGGPARRGWDRVLHAVALSLVLLMAAGLVVAVLPGVGLSRLTALVAFDVTMTLLTVAALLRRPPAAPAPAADTPASAPTVDTPTPTPTPTPGAAAGGPGTAAAEGPVAWWWRPGAVPAVAGPVAAMAALACAVGGAHRLNAGGGPELSLAALALAVAALVAAALAGRWQWTGAAATTVYLLGAAVLLATSLRGEVVTGHDIKVEYRVFLATFEQGAWVPGGPYPAYMSCLSLTVLPSLLAHLLGVEPLDVFRVCYQLVFALVPVGVLLIARRVLPPGYAVLTAGLFVAFPTFVNDMPMLNRQEIALVFFTVALLALLEPGPRWRRGTLLAVAAAGLTVSHYSSAAVTAALLGGAWLVRCVWRIAGRRWTRRLDPLLPVLPGLFVPAATLILMVIGWAFVAGTAATFAESVTDIGRAVTGRAEVRSDSARYALPPGAAATDEMVLSRYVTVVTQPRREQGAPPAGADCAVTVLPGDVLPTGPAGDAVAAAGVPPGTLNTAVRQSVVLLYEGGAILGCVLVWWRLRRSTGVRRAAAVLVAEVGTAAVGLLALSVVAPQVTDSYGLLRLYQQLLPVLGVTVVLALVTGTRLVTRRRPGRLAHAIAVAVVAGCLVTTSGLLPRLTGGYPPQLNSAASGPYQHGYLAGRADAAAAAATRERLPRDGWVIADTRDSLNLRALTPLTPDDGLAPGAVPVDAYLLARRTGGDRIAATAVIGDRIIRYTFPASCVTAGRSALWTGAEHVLYGPARPVTG